MSEVPADCFYPDLLIRVAFNPSLLRPRFTCLQWNSKYLHCALLKRAKSTNGIWKINGTDIRIQRIAVPSLTAQDRFLDQISTVEAGIVAANDRETQLAHMKRALLDETFRNQHAI